MFSPQIAQSSKTVWGDKLANDILYPYHWDHMKPNNFMTCKKNKKKTFVTKTEVKNLHFAVLHAAENDFFWKGGKCLIYHKGTLKRTRANEEYCFLTTVVITSHKIYQARQYVFYGRERAIHAKGRPVKKNPFPTSWLPWF